MSHSDLRWSTEIHARALQLRKVENNSITQIAAALGFSPSYVKSKLRGVAPAHGVVRGRPDPRGPLPAGSPETWGVISSEPWPGGRAEMIRPHHA